MGTASEYFMIDVMNSCSRKEQDGTSLQNEEHASAIALLIRDLLGEGLLAKDIAILTYYNGQKPVLLHKIRAKLTDVGLDWEVYGEPLRISSVDAIQGGEIRFIMVDFVAAVVPKEFKRGNNPEATETKPLSGHVTSVNRLMTAITRAMDGLVIVGNHRSMVKDKPVGTPESLPLSELAKDAQRRELISYDVHSWDPVMEKTMGNEEKKSLEIDAQNFLRVRSTSNVRRLANDDATLILRVHGAAVLRELFQSVVKVGPEPLQLIKRQVPSRIHQRRSVGHHDDRLVFGMREE